MNIYIFYGKKKGADAVGWCALFNGKDRHDTDGSLSLGLGEASGRVDVPVRVGVLLSSEEVCRYSQSVAFVTPGSCVVKAIFVKRVDGSTRVHRVKGHTEEGELDCTVDVGSRVVERRWILGVP